ncbi:MAG: acyl carrier protein, partial [Polyangiaceae bacterium]
ALQDQVRELTVKVLGVGRTSNFDVHEPLRQLGLDSLMAVELRNLLAKTVGRAMPATITFDFPSVNALADYIADTVFGDELFTALAPASIPVPDEPAVELSAEDEHDDLTSDELAARLAERLDRLFLEESK